MEKTKEELEKELHDTAEVSTEEEIIAETEVVEEVSEFDKLKEELASVKNDMLKDRAELENFKRRSNEERIRERKYAQQFILGRLIDMNDNLERALNTENYESVEKFKEGVTLIKNQLNQILETEKVEEIEALNKEFNPNYHQAVFTESNDEYDDDIVLEVLQKGYMYKDRTLRPSMVKVNKKEN
ncbi:nucleotide exchange factor GrpE [Mycoplasmatota bacterium WC44]